MKTLRQNALFETGHPREMRSLREQTEEAERSTANIEGRLETIFSECSSLNNFVKVRSAALKGLLKKRTKTFRATLARTSSCTDLNFVGCSQSSSLLNF